jgi:hypothetical protein
MPTPKYFSKIPEFPSDVKVIDIPTISFENLKKGIEQDSDNLFEASREYGFFLLDLRNSEEGERLLKDAEKMFDLTAATFDLGPEVLEQKYAYNPPKSLLGYDIPVSLDCKKSIKTQRSDPVLLGIKALANSLRTMAKRML